MGKQSKNPASQGQVNPSGVPSPKEELEIRKLESEAQKIQWEAEKARLEFQDVSRPFWLRPMILLNILPLLIALAAVFTGWVNGVFDGQSKLLEAKRERLGIDVKEFEQRTNQLGLTILSLEGRSKTLEITNKSLQATSSNLLSQLLESVAETTLQKVETEESRSIQELYKRVVEYRQAGEERIDKAFQPLTSKIEEYRRAAEVADKAAKEFPADAQLSLKSKEADAAYSVAVAYKLDMKLDAQKALDKSLNEAAAGYEHRIKEVGEMHKQKVKTVLQLSLDKVSLPTIQRAQKSALDDVASEQARLMGEISETLKSAASHMSTNVIDDKMPFSKP